MHDGHIPGVNFDSPGMFAMKGAGCRVYAWC